MMQIKLNFDNFFYFVACVCHSLAACQRYTPSSLAAVIGLSNNDVILLRCLRCVRCVGWKPRLNLHGGWSSYVEVRARTGQQSTDDLRRERRLRCLKHENISILQ